MIDTVESDTAANPVGDRLRAAREAKGVSLDDVANQTRVPTRHLQHIENGDWDALPAVTYSVGFARAYANAVGLDGNEIGRELRAQLGGSQSSAATAPYEPADPARVPPRSLAIIAGVIALLLVIGYFVWRSGAVEEADPLAEAAAVDTPIAPPPPTPQGQRPAGQPQAAAATGPVAITATDEVWLRIYDGGGGPALFQGNLAVGQRFEVPATAQRPLIRTGRPNAIQVTVGTTPIPALGEPERTIGDVSLLPADLLARVQEAAPAQPAPQPAPQAAPAR